MSKKSRKEREKSDLIESLPRITRSRKLKPTTQVNCEPKLDRAQVSLSLGNQLWVCTTSILDLPMIEGRLRYLLCRESCITPRMSNVSIFFSLGVLALEKIQDLSVLIFWPQAASYNRRISIRCQHSWLLTLQNKKRRSSAKKKK